MSTQYGPLPPWDGVAPVALLDRVRRFNRAVLNPVVQRLAGRLPGPLAIVRHRGRATGRIYLTPVVAQQIADGFVIPLTYGERADWVKNALATGRMEIRQAGVTYAVGEPVVLDDHAALPLLSPMLRFAVRLVGMKRFMRLTRRGHQHF